MRSCFVILAVAVAACGANDPASHGEVTQIPDCITSGLAVSPASATLHAGDSLQARVSVPACSFGQSARYGWMSSDTVVAVVDSAGLIRARKQGTATVIASLLSDPNVKGAMALSVQP